MSAQAGGREPFGDGYAWVIAAIPADARSFRVSEPGLRLAFQQSGATLTEDAPDVEIGRLGDLRGGASAAVALAPGRFRRSGSWFAARVASRVARGALLRAWLVGARAALRSKGYPYTGWLLFDIEQRVRRESLRSARLAERLPRDGAATGAGRTGTDSLLDAVSGDAARSAARPLGRVEPILRSGILVAITDGGVLRIAIGDSSRQLLDQAAVLRAIRTRPLVDAIESRVPALLAAGETGLTKWTLESRLPGKGSAHVLTPVMLDDSLTFIIQLGQLERGIVSRELLTQAGEIVARTARAPEVGLLAERAGSVLDGAPAVFGHGDYCSSNLLVESGRLSGVVDWEAAGPGELALLDLLHLLLLHECQPDVYRWGRAVTTQLAALAARTDGPVADYLDALGLTFDARERSALVVAYWLKRVAYQLSTYSGRARDRRWLEENVRRPAAAFRAR